MESGKKNIENLNQVRNVFFFKNKKGEIDNTIDMEKIPIISENVSNLSK